MFAKIGKRDYTTKKRITYSFEANWVVSDQVVSWDAKVWKAGQVVGTQEGSFPENPGADTSNLVAGRVRANLEAGAVSVTLPRPDA